MGYGGYSSSDRMLRVTESGILHKSAREVFSERSINNAMSPMDVDCRESRDSTEHPNSIPVILALDVTGSMGSIPHYLVKEGLPNMMDKIIKGGVPDPQVLFMGIGDHECDSAPLQVGQFESNDSLLDHWLTKLFLEGGGGGNDGESYLLAWYFASRHVQSDHWDKRHKKGVLFTVGDEPTLKNIPAKHLKHIMGTGQYDNITAKQLLDAAREKFECYHLHLTQGSAGRRQDVQESWTKLMEDRVIFIDHKEDVAQVIADKVVLTVINQNSVGGPARFDGVA